MEKAELDQRLEMLLVRVGLDPKDPPKYPWLHRMDKIEAEKRLRLLEERYK